MPDRPDIVNNLDEHRSDPVGSYDDLWGDSSSLAFDMEIGAECYFLAIDALVQSLVRYAVLSWMLAQSDSYQSGP